MVNLVCILYVCFQEHSLKPLFYCGIYMGGNITIKKHQYGLEPSSSSDSNTSRSNSYLTRSSINPAAHADILAILVSAQALPVAPAVCSFHSEEQNVTPRIYGSLRHIDLSAERVHSVAADLDHSYPQDTQ